MRSAGNFSPEWGYLAPAPSFARAARVVLVATAIGATAGAGVVLSLIDRPSEPEKTPVAARAIVTSVRAEAVPSAAPASTAPTTTAAPATLTAPAKPASPSRASVAAPPPSDKPAAVNAAVPTPAASTAAVPASATASTSASAAEPSNIVDAAPAGAPDSTTIMAPEQAPPAKKTKHHASSNRNQFPGIGSVFRRMFASHGSRSYYPNSQ
jgi:hypothetical protein